MSTAIDHLKQELKNIRTNRANPAMLDGIQAEIYGVPTRLKEIASITTPESRQLLISLFDPRNAGTVSKAIEKANIGLQPYVDGNVIRIKIPPMDENTRKEMVKICHRKLEESKISIRSIRRDANELIKKQKAQGDIAEDQLKKFEKDVQKLTDDFCKEIDTLGHKKEGEILTI